jgi:hypothetical protein
MGYDALLFDGPDDADMILTALRHDRLILTRDSRLMDWGVIAGGRVRAMLIESDRPAEQIRQVVARLGLETWFKPFTVCLECNQPLREAGRTEVERRVPLYVLETHDRFLECPACHRVYWRGTHWQAMRDRLEHLKDV